MLINTISPIFFSITNIPLIAKSYNTFVLTSANNFVFWLIIDQSFFRLDKLFFDKCFCIYNLHSLIFSYCFSAHDSFVKTFCISFFFCLSQFFSIILRLDSHLVANHLRSHISVTWNIYYRNWFKTYHLFSNSVFFS